MSQSKWVRVGSVRRFDYVMPDKAQALMPLEEAAEVFGAWQIYDSYSDAEAAREVGFTESERLDIMRLSRERVLAECADVIQATLNLVAAYGVEDFRPWMKACEERNRERGRITDGWSEQPGWWECDRCGTSIYWDAVDEPPSCNYCPNCGAKVVDE